MKLLVTGGMGFIGSHFIRYILNKYPSYEVINLDKLTKSANPNTLKDLHNESRYEFIKGDICDQELVDSIVKRVDAIIHFAAESQNDIVNHKPLQAIRTNIEGTFILLDAAYRNGKIRFHHVSTDEVFGHLLDTKDVFKEDSPLSPRSFYPATKASSDFLVNSFFITKKLPITISNCTNNYGPYQQPANLIPKFVINLYLGNKVPLYGDGSNRRNWLYVQDHCQALDLILHKGKIGERYCIGGSVELSNLELTYKILEIMGLGDDKIEFVEDRPGHDWRYAVSNEKIHKLGFKESSDFDQDLQNTVLWYTNNKGWWEPMLK